MDRTTQPIIPSPSTAHIAVPSSNPVTPSSTMQGPTSVASLPEASLETLPHLQQPESETKPLIDWRKKMSDHIAYALLVYTTLQIFMTLNQLKSSHGASLLPYFALIILVLAIIPACRAFESHWNQLSETELHDPAFAGMYKRDRLFLWILAIGLPFALTALFKGLALFFS